MMQTRPASAVAALLLLLLLLGVAFAPAAAQTLPEEGRARARAAREQAARQRDRVRRERGAERQGPEHSETFSRSVRLPRNGTLELTNAVGDVTITGGEGDEVRIDAVKRVRAADETTAKQRLQALTIALTERQDAIDVRSESSPRGRVRVDYTVTLPSGANVNVRTVSGDVRVTNVRGEVRAHTVSGSVTGSGLERVRSIRAFSGDISLSNASADELRLETVSGAVLARGLQARYVELETVSGDIQFAEVNAERVSLRSVSGDIEYAGRLARGGRYDLQSHSGDIRVLPAGNPGFSVDASSFNGDIRSAFELRSTPARGEGALNRALRGTAGDGSASLLLRTFNGGIAVEKP